MSVSYTHLDVYKRQLEQSYPLLIAMAVIVVLVMVIYGVAVARTANREIGKLKDVYKRQPFVYVGS